MSNPPLIPPQQVGYQAPQNQAAQNAEQYSEYQRVADTVGMVPNIRLKDNLYQLIAGRWAP